VIEDRDLDGLLEELEPLPESLRRPFRPVEFALQMQVVRLDVFRVPLAEQVLLFGRELQLQLREISVAISSSVAKISATVRLYWAPHS